MNTSETPHEHLPFICPRCNQTVTATTAQAGTRTECPHCRQTIKVPGTQPTTNTAGTAPSSATVLGDPRSKNAQLVITCTYCETSLHASLDQVGQAITCSECLESVVVPPIEEASPVTPTAPPPVSSANPPGNSASAIPPAGEQDEYKLADQDDEIWSEVRSSPSPQTAGDPAATAAQEEDEYKLADLDSDPVPLPPVTQPTTDGLVLENNDDEIVELEAVDNDRDGMPPSAGPTPPADRLGLEPLTDAGNPASAELSPADANREFGILCGLCGTRMYVRMRDVGKEVKCPDCYSMTLVYEPKKKPRSRGATDASENDDHRDLVKLAPEVEIERPEDDAKRVLAQSTLRRAQENETQHRRDQDPGLELETPPLVLLKFLLQPHTVGYWLLLGLGGATLASCLYYAVNPPSVDAASLAKLISFALWCLTSIVGVLVLAFASVTLWTVAGETANGTRNVEHLPPVMGFLDWALDTLYVHNATWLGALPGAAIALSIHWLGVPLWISLIFVVLSLAIIFPVVLAGMLQSDSAFVPFSPVIWRSLKQQSASWSTFYLVSPLILLIAYGAGCGYAYGNPIVNFPLSLVVVVMLFVYFRLLGWVVWKIREQNSTGASQ